jgi:hypothetical protein
MTQSIKRIAPLAAIAICLAFSSSAQAQSARSIYLQNTTRRPTVSPYLSLLENSNSYTAQYQSRVRPEIEQRQINFEQANRLANLQRQVDRSLTQQSQYRDSTLRGTGHVTFYRNYLHYYPTLAQQRR